MYFYSVYSACKILKYLNKNLKLIDFNLSNKFIEQYHHTILLILTIFLSDKIKNITDRIDHLNNKMKFCFLHEIFKTVFLKG